MPNVYDIFASKETTAASSAVNLNPPITGATIIIVITKSTTEAAKTRLRIKACLHPYTVQTTTSATTNANEASPTTILPAVVSQSGAQTTKGYLPTTTMTNIPTTGGPGSTSNIGGSIGTTTIENLPTNLSGSTTQLIPTQNIVSLASGSPTGSTTTSQCPDIMKDETSIQNISVSSNPEYVSGLAENSVNPWTSTDNDPLPDITVMLAEGMDGNIVSVQLVSPENVATFVVTIKSSSGDAVFTSVSVKGYCAEKHCDTLKCCTI